MNPISYDDARELNLFPSKPFISQTMKGGKAAFSVRYEFVNFSFSDFKETCSYRHPAPPFARIFAIERGRVLLRTPERKKILKGGDIYFLAPEMPFEATYFKGTAIKGFHVLVRDALGFAVGAELRDLPRIRDANLLGAISSAAASGDMNLCMASVLQPLWLFLRPLQGTLERRAGPTPSERRLFEALNSEAPGGLRVESLAKRLGTSRSALSKSFVRKFKIPLKKHLEALLTDKARALLSTTTLTAAEIAYELGCKEPSHFQRLFKARVGMTPLEYRHLAAGRNGDSLKP